MRYLGLVRVGKYFVEWNSVKGETELETSLAWGKNQAGWEEECELNSEKKKWMGMPKLSDGRHWMPRWGI